MIAMCITRVKELRKRNKISQYKVGLFLGIPQPKVSDIERGKRELTLKEAIKLAILFNVKVDDLINWNGVIKK
jgi:transcriptional regulator with XRE-family HTH domain